jgi:long-chain acyl-CoA synthetase
MKENNIPFQHNNDIINNPKVVAFYRELIDSFNKFFNQVEQIKKFKLLPDEWSVDTGEMTPKLSMRRKVIQEKYQTLVDEMYQ